MLHEIEARAGALFADHGYPHVGGEPAPLDGFRDLVFHNETLVAVDAAGRPLGFAVSNEIGGIWWLKELGVDPDVMRRGVGTALLDAVARQAREKGHDRVGLSTFRDVPFNAPFYSRRGFVIIAPEDASKAIRERFEAEIPAGVGMHERVLMIRKLPELGDSVMRLM